MNKTLEMSITPSYVPHWNVETALREFLQNALDSQRKGFKMEITSNGDSVLLTNYGATLPIKTLLLGETTKTNDSETIGQFGEGYKLACLVLARKGIEISISSPIGTISPAIIYSENYKTEVLAFHINEKQKFLPGVQIFFKKPVTESWLKSLILPEDPYTPRIIKDQPGAIFLNGLSIKLKEVTETENLWHWGYNLPSSLELDRDRMMVDAYSLSSEMISLLIKTESIESIYFALENPIPEFKGLEYYQIPGDKDEQILALFLSKYGKTAYVLSSSEYSERENITRNAGFIPVKMNPSPLRIILKRSQLSWGLVLENAKSSTEAFTTTTLTTRQKENLHLAQEVLKETLQYNLTIIPVNFSHPNTRGMYKGSTGEIFISSKTFNTVGELIVTITHELTHQEIKSHSDVFWQGFENKIGKVITELYSMEIN